MLYIVATPIGNLGDITYRAVQTLKGCDLILCEDTRRTAILCQHYDIATPLRSFHQFNEFSRQEEVIDKLEQGQKIALVSDAGTPLISDPGQPIVAACCSKALEVCVIPGACAAIVALAGSGLSCEQFRFWGFLPRKAGALKENFTRMLLDPATHIVYESPKRLIKSLITLCEIYPNCEVCVARELTKTFEEFIRGTAEKVVKKLQEKPLKGEIVLLLRAPQNISNLRWQQMTAVEQVTYLEQEFSIERSVALKLAAELRGCPKKHLYKELLDS